MGDASRLPCLLELDFGCTKDDILTYESTIYRLQGQGWRVVIPHPERYDAIRRDASLAERLVNDGCELQASADFTKRNRHGSSKRTALRLLREGLYTYIASDAHSPADYAEFMTIMGQYGHYLSA